MKTLTVRSNALVAPAAARPFTLRKALLACGIASSIVYLAINLLGGLMWPGYSHIDQTFSELIGVDAPSRPVTIPLSIVYAFLIYAFSAGIWLSAGQKKALKIAAALIFTKEILGLVGTLYAPIHLRGVPGTASDGWHGIITMVGVLLCMLPAMGFGAAAFGKRFRIYSIVTMLVFLVCGILAGMYQPAYSANLPTPYMGLLERINIYGYLLWIVVFAVQLWRRQLEPAAEK